MVYHAANCIFNPFGCNRILNSFTDGNAKAAGSFWILRLHFSAKYSLIAGAWINSRTKRLHQGFTVWLLVKAYFYHIHSALQTKKVARHGQSAAPLSRTGLRCEALDAFLFIIISLSNRGV